jgi:hypothetical protein
MDLPREPISADARLEAAAISIKMIAAKSHDIAPYIDIVARRFAVEQTALRDAIGTHAVERTYERIHANDLPESRRANARSAA